MFSLKLWYLSASQHDVTVQQTAVEKKKHAGIGAHIKINAFANVSAQIIPGLLVLAIAYLGCNITLVLIAWFFAVTLITASYAGAMASVVDIAPNLAGKETGLLKEYS